MKKLFTIFIMLCAICTTGLSQKEHFSNRTSNSVLLFPPSEIKYFDLNYVSAPIQSYGTMFMDYYTHYTVPADSGTTSIFAGDIWIGGKNQDGNIHLAAERFNQNGFDLYPGPLKTQEANGTCDSTNCAMYNKVWKIDRSDLEQLSINFEAGLQPDFPEDIETWPAHGSENYAYYLAPFNDYDQDGNYDPTNGDLPEILGDQMLYWITNDNLFEHTESGGLPLGIELQHSFYGFRFDEPLDEMEDLINYQTFYNLKIINRSENQYDSVYIGVWVDGDIGNSEDDLIGCDVQRNSFYFYNADNYEKSGLENNSPVQTVTILNSPLLDDNGMDDDNDGTVDNEQTGMSKFIHFNNNTGGLPASTDPNVGIEYYNYMQAIWLDNSVLCYGGSGHLSDSNCTGIPCDYAFPGDSDPTGIGTGGIVMEPWSDQFGDLCNPQNDRRGLLGMGPVTLIPGEIIEIDLLFGFFSDCNNGSRSNLNYETRLDSLITWFHEDRIPSNYLAAELADIQQSETEINPEIYPNPVNNKLFIQNIEENSTFSILDQQGRILMQGNYNHNIDVNSLPNGIYFIRLNHNQSIITERFVIIRK